MMDLVDSVAMDAFMNGPFLQWLKQFPEAPTEITFDTMISGSFLPSVLQSFDASFTSLPANNEDCDSSLRRMKISNVESVIKSLKTYYEDVLSQTLIMRLPDALAICQDPPTKQSLLEMETLLLLILGAAVQCNQKEHHIRSIKSLPLQTQEAFMEKINEVTDNPNRIWTAEYSDPRSLSAAEKDDFYLLLVRHVRTLVKERDDFAHQVVEVCIASPPNDDCKNTNITPERNHLALELSELKAQIRRLKEQLDEKTEAYTECKEEVDKYIAKSSKLRQENIALSQEARTVRALRDELDIQRERVHKVHNLESEIQVYKDKVNQMESLKLRMDEVKEENKILMETKDMLEEQLESSRKRCHQIMSLENELYVYKSELSSCQIDLESSRRRIEELTEENSALLFTNKNSLSESQSLMAEMEVVHDQRGNDTNLMFEQMNHNKTLVHKLKLENQKLLSEVDDLKMNGIKEVSEKILKLERDNKRQTMTINQLEGANAKESDDNIALRQDLNKSQVKNRQLEQLVATLKETDEQVRIEKETVIENLTKQIDSLRERREQTTNDQMKYLEEENGKLLKNNTLLDSKVCKLEHEKKQLQNKAQKYEDCVERLEEMSEMKDQMSKHIESLKKENERLTLAKEDDSVAIQDLKTEYSKLQKLSKKLNTETGNLREENSKIKLDAQKANRSLEAMRTANKNNTQALENERDDLLDMVNKLKLKVDNLSVSSKKHEEQEQKLTSVSFENSRLSRQNQNLTRKLAELEMENKAVESENQKLEKNIENLRTVARRVEQLEKENFALEDAHHKIDREHNQMSREHQRLKQGNEVKDSTIEDLNLKVINLEREKNKLMRDLEQWSSEHSNIVELEQENRKLAQSCTLDKKALVEIRRELVEEKMKNEDLSNNLDKVHKQLKKIGFDPESLEDELTSQEHLKDLEGSMTKLLESKQKRLINLEMQLKATKDENLSLKQRLEVLKLQAQGGGGGGDAKTDLEAELANVVKDRDKLKNELLSVGLECNSAHEKVAVYERKLKKLQEEIVQIQVENSTLQSHSSSLLSQINSLQTSSAALETSKRKLQDEAKHWEGERSGLLRDQAELQKLHDSLQRDYEKMLMERASQKDVERKLRSDLRQLQSKSVALSEDQDDLLRAKEAMDLERENLRSDTRSLANLRSEHTRLKDDFRSLFTSNERVKSEFCNLQTDYKALKTTYNQLKLRETGLKGELGETKEQLAILDVEHTKALNRCDVLAQFNNSLEEDRKSLMSQVSILLTQYHELLTQTMDDKEHFHEEEKCFTDRMNNLSRQKEKLEEKIMEQYKRMGNYTPKKIGFGGQLVRKMKKASSNLMLTSNRGRVRSGESSVSFTPEVISSSSPSMLTNFGPLNEERDSCSSIDNDSSPSPPPTELARSGSIDEVNNRKASILSSSRSASSHLNQEGRRNITIPSHLEDSDGNNADDDSVNSFSVKNTNQRLIHTMDAVDGDEMLRMKAVPERIGHSELGIPVNPPSTDNRSRNVSRIFVDGKGWDSEGTGVMLDLSGSHQLTTGGWKSSDASSTSSPVPSHDGQGQDVGLLPPVVPARKQSRIGEYKDNPPQRPPKPGRRRGDDNGAGDATDGAINDEVENKTVKNTEWYEYGCV